MGTKWYWMPCREMTRKGAVAHRIARLVHDEVLLCGQGPAGDADPHAEVVDVESLPSPLRAHVAVVLLVDAVEPEQLLALRRERWRSVGQLLADGAPQLVTGGLDSLDLGAGGVGYGSSFQAGHESATEVAHLDLVEAGGL
ncbi:MAG: hypothetical protein ACRD07_03640 [Acidimicrobiales bacterium]